jgi:predicted acyltransferase
MGTERSDTSRLVFLDQFRGYTVLGMFFVNFIGGCVAMPAIFKHHHTYLSYADTIMPQFFLAAGFAYRLTWLKRREQEGTRAAVHRVVWRSLGLILIGLLVYHLDGRAGTWEELRQLGFWGVIRQGFQRNPFQTLVHIGITTLWVLPVIDARPLVRIAFLAASGALFVVLSQAFYYDWVMKRPGIDGGPLGFLTWTIPMLAGSLACDMVRQRPATAPTLGGFVSAGALLMLLGYGLACLNLVTPPNALPEPARLTDALVEPPFVPPARAVNLWTMSQRAGSVTYLLFSSGFALAILAAFRLAGTVRWLRLGYLDLLGKHALAGYIIHDLAGELLKPYVPKDAPWWYVLAAFAVFLGVITVFLTYLERHRIYLRL